MQFTILDYSKEVFHLLYDETVALAEPLFYFVAADPDMII